ncbi:hypothetical protein FA048_12720 [Pedobacter polaris]|uniref:Uncharacterized protein n=1 Tax=Pedobacter polaris TaxID=2571273 RepID=A0A4U1CK68_9SPHI|nr:hypothetical protein [Pedobacter polaris]TKC08020.1 hypothetical protein FA048_12720 [Pedobacter polaris]
MKSILICLIAFFIVNDAIAQRLVFDRAHFNIVNENGAVRNAAEITHNQYLGKIDNNLQDINVNVGSVVAAQTMIYQGLSNVNSALKNGLAVKNMAYIVADIVSYSSKMVEMGKAEPYLLLFAENMGRQMKARSFSLVNEVSEFILKEGSNVLMDYNARDQLLRKVTKELQIIAGLTYGAWKAMYWAKQKGIIKSLNPWAAYINNDKIIVNDIIRNAKYLKQ